MAVQRPPLNVALANWQQRAQQYDQLGIPRSNWYQIALQDINNVSTTGAAPMTTTDVNAAMAAQFAGHSLIGNQQSHPHGLFGNIETFFSSAPSDIGGLITGFLGGAAHFVRHLPSEVTGMGDYLAHASDSQWLQEHGYEDPNGKDPLARLAVDLRNMSKQPVLNLVPGVAVAADLTTSSGRQYALHHPVTDFLDVVPAVGAKAVGEGVTAFRGVPARPGTALEALGQGKAIRAGARGFAEGVDVLSRRKLSSAVGRAYGIETAGRTRADLFQEAAARHGLGFQARDVLRRFSLQGRQISRNAIELVKQIDAVDKTLTPEQRTQLYQDNVNGTHSTPELQAAWMSMKQIEHKLLAMGETEFSRTKGKTGLLVVPLGKGRMVFAATEPVLKPLRRIRTSQIHISAARRRIGQGRRSLDKLEAKKNQLLHDIAQAQLRRMPHDALLRNLADLNARIASASKRITNAASRLKQAQAVLKQSRIDYRNALYKMGGPRAAQSRVARDMQTVLAAHRRKVSDVQIQRLHDNISDPDELELRVSEALNQLKHDLGIIQDYSNFAMIRKAFIGPAEVIGEEAVKRATKQFEDYRNEVVKNVLDLIAAGYDPLWVKHVDPAKEDIYLSPNPIPDHNIDITQYNKATFNFNASSHDVALGLSAAAIELFRAKGTERFLAEAVMPHAQSTSILEDQYAKLARDEQALGNMKRRPGQRVANYSVKQRMKQMKDAEWVVIHPENYGLGSFPHGGRFSRKDEINIPKWLAHNLQRLEPSYRLPINSSTYDRALHVFRFSVLTGPRHIVHVAIAGLVPLMAEEPRALIHIPRAYRIVRAYQRGEHGDLESLLHESVKHIYDFTDAMQNYSVGRQLGSILGRFWQHTGRPVQQGLARIEETASDMYRTAALLSASKRGLSNEQALAIANKIAVDMDDMSPLERTVVKQVFPFYGFTRFLFRYLLTYPVDHPYRAAIISRFATQEQEDWNSLIPQKFMQTLFLGKPDQFGNIKTIDLRNLNPFRSFSNDFTLVGFFQSLNPILTLPFTAHGFDVLTGVGPLYPSLEFNPQSGTLQAAAPSGKDQLFNAISQFIPEVGALDHFIGITDRMRILKRSNPAAYRAALFSQLNLPGVLAPPISVNLPYVEERAEMDRYKAAQQAVSTGEKGLGWGKAEGFQLVPYQGQYVDPNQLANYWQSLVSQTPGIDPRALIAQPKRRTSQDPLSLLAGLGQVPPAQSTEGY